MPRTIRKKLPVLLIMAGLTGVVASIAVLWCVVHVEDWWFRPENATVVAESRPTDPQLIDLSRRAVTAMERWQR